MRTAQVWKVCKCRHPIFFTILISNKTGNRKVNTTARTQSGCETEMVTHSRWYHNEDIHSDQITARSKWRTCGHDHNIEMKTQPRGPHNLNGHILNTSDKRLNINGDQMITATQRRCLHTQLKWPQIHTTEMRTEPGSLNRPDGKLKVITR